MREITRAYNFVPSVMLLYRVLLSLQISISMPHIAPMPLHFILLANNSTLHATAASLFNKQLVAAGRGIWIWVHPLHVRATIALCANSHSFLSFYIYSIEIFVSPT